jgi:hypothetical protein
MYHVSIWDFAMTAIHSGLKMEMFIPHYPRVFMPATGHFLQVTEKSE